MAGGGTVIKNLTCNGGAGGVVCVTIANPAADISPSSQECISCLVSQKSGTQIYMNIDTAVTSGTMATSTDWKLSSTPIAVPIHNLNQLHFLGTAADIAQIIWRN